MSDISLGRRYEELEEVVQSVASGEASAEEMVEYVEELSASLDSAREEFCALRIEEEVLPDFLGQIKLITDGLESCQEGLKLLRDFREHPSVELLERGLLLAAEGFQSVSMARVQGLANSRELEKIEISPEHAI